MLAILNICVFVLPCESGERAGYAITVFLAFAVFLTIISSTLPESSENVAVFSIYLIIQTTSSTVITILALVMIRFHFKDDEVDPVPRWLGGLLNTITCKRCRKPNKKITVVEPIGKKGTDDYPDDITDAMDQPTLTWKKAMSLVDRICFIFFFLVFLLSTSLSFIVAALL